MQFYFKDKMPEIFANVEYWSHAIDWNAL